VKAVQGNDGYIMCWDKAEF